MLEQTEIERKLEYFSRGAEDYKTERMKRYRNEYLEYLCKNLKTTPQEMKRKDSEYYDMLLKRAVEATDKMWKKEEALILKWKKQREDRINSTYSCINT